jgi:phospholipid/cholesterol/gamma-HCH transport system substrate-binding protein
MKVSNETKVGALTIIGITILILGFNFLKGNNLFQKSTLIYASYDDIDGLTVSNPIFIKGLQVGTVRSIEPSRDMQHILVTFSITKDVDIPVNSVAHIISSPLAASKVEINLGDARTFIKAKDTIDTKANPGIIENVMKKVDPVLYQVNKSLHSLDSLIGNVNSVLDSKMKQNIAEMLANLNTVSASMAVSTESLKTMLNTENGSLAKSLDNVSSITGNLASNNQKINHVISNIDSTTQKLAQLDLQKILLSLEGTMAQLKDVTAKMNNGQGSIGLLLNDPSLYRNLASTGNKLNLLLDDLRMNPKRYISFSVFGKKNKTNPLMQPLPDTVSSPYIIQSKTNP